MDQGTTVYCLANIGMGRAILEDSRFLSLCTPPGQELADIALAQVSLKKIAPACCWLPPGKLDRVLELAGIGIAYGMPPDEPITPRVV